MKCLALDVSRAKVGGPVFWKGGGLGGGWVTCNLSAVPKKAERSVALSSLVIFLSRGLNSLPIKRSRREERPPSAAGLRSCSMSAGRRETGDGERARQLVEV